MVRLLQIEFIKLWNNRASKILIVSYFLILTSIALIAAIKFDIGPVKFHLADIGIFNFPYIWHFNTYVTAFFKLFLAIVIVSMMANEYSNKTIKQNLVLNKANMRRAIGDIIPSPQFWIGQSAAGNPPIGPKLNAYYVGVSVPTQITSFNQGDIAEFRAQKRQFKYEYGAQKNVITAEVSSAYNNILAARQWLKVYEDHVLADSYEVARLARRSYEVGQSDITSTLQAQQNNVQIRSLYLEAISLYQKAFTELEMACGTPLLEEE